MRRRRGVGLLAVLILLLGMAAAAWLLLSREPPAQAAQGPQGALVRAVAVEQGSYRLSTSAQGTVVPARRIQIQPQVQGRLVEVHPQLIPGGVIEQGEVLFRVDPQDYRLAVEEARTAVEQAQADLALERGRQQVAQEEWELFRDELGEQQGNRALATRQPQLQAARAALQAARHRLARAQLNLQRTAVRAPFDGFVQDETAAVGQLVGPQQPVLTFVGSDRFWLRLAVPVDRLPYIDIPGLNAEQGSPVHVVYDAGGRSIERAGRVLRLEGRLNPEGRMARLLVEIQDPLGLAGAGPPGQRVPMLLEAYVDARIRGPEAAGLVELPRAALREGDRAYVVRDGRLLVRKLQIAWRRPDAVLVEDGLQPGDQVVVSPLAQAYEGMAVRVESQPSPAAGEGPAAAAPGAADEAGGAAPPRDPLPAKDHRWLKGA